MTRADLTLFRRMRGLFWGLLVGGVVVVPTLFVLGLTVPAQLDMFSADTTRSIGGPADVFRGSFGFSGIVASIGAAILGATAGSVDLQRGVLRDLVLAGRSRTRIVIGRILAAAVLLLLALAVSFALTIVIGATFAPVREPIEWTGVAREGAQFLPGIAYTLPFAAGIALLIGSRGLAIAVYFVIALVIDNALIVIPRIGDWWAHVSLSQADAQVNAWIRDASTPLGRPHWEAALVLVGWATIPLAGGLVRLSRRDL